VCCGRPGPTAPNRSSHCVRARRARTSSSPAQPRPGRRRCLTATLSLPTVGRASRCPRTGTSGVDSSHRISSSRMAPSPACPRRETHCRASPSSSATETSRPQPRSFQCPELAAFRKGAPGRGQRKSGPGAAPFPPAPGPRPTGRRPPAPAAASLRARASPISQTRKRFPSGSQNQRGAAAPSGLSCNSATGDRRRR
jgi:hypothetical protein